MTNLGAAMAGGMSPKGELKSREREADDFYPTPPEVTRALLYAWQPRARTIWEPACGDGALASVMTMCGYQVVATDLRHRGYRGQTFTGDFLREPRRRADCLITNPPFALAEFFIRHAWHLGIEEMALLLKATYWHAATRQKLWRMWPPAMILPLTWRVDFLDLGAPTMEVAWVVWDRAHLGNPVYRPIGRPGGGLLDDIDDKTGEAI